MGRGLREALGLKFGLGLGGVRECTESGGLRSAIETEVGIGSVTENDADLGSNRVRAE